MLKRRRNPADKACTASEELTRLVGRERLMVHRHPSTSFRPLRARRRRSPSVPLSCLEKAPAGSAGSHRQIGRKCSENPLRCPTDSANNGLISEHQGAGLRSPGRWRARPETIHRIGVKGPGVMASTRPMAPGGRACADLRRMPGHTPCMSDGIGLFQKGGEAGEFSKRLRAETRSPGLDQRC